MKLHKNKYYSLTKTNIHRTKSISIVTKFNLISGKTYCSGCEKKCSGEVFKIIGDKYFHIDCFRCKSKFDKIEF